MKKTAKFILLFVLLLSLFTPSQSVHADVSPPPAPQLGGLEPFGYQQTNVQMVYERVEMEVQPFLYFDSPYYASRVNVVAYFTMHNNGNVSESMQVVFPLESFSNCRMGYGGGNSYTNYFVQENTFSAIVDGVEVPIQKIITDHPNKVDGICDKMSWAGFDITFPVDDDVVIKVQYVMETLGGSDSMQNIEYILETGAGWAGPIKRGYVIVKLPYTTSKENVLSESTSGYQFLYNEIFWSFENLEPTSKDNIQVSIVSPDVWQEILSLRRDLKQNPRLPEKWLELAQIYEGISTWHADNIRSEEYFQKVFSVYEQGISANQDNAELYAKYAEFKLFSWSPRLIGQLTNEQAAQILSLLNRALALEPNNETAKTVLSYLRDVAPSVTYTPPSTIPPTATSQFTVTPSVTPSATITPLPSETPVVVTVVHTKIVNESKVITATPEPGIPTAKPSSTEISTQDEPQKEISTVSIVFGSLILFAAGIGVGVFWQRRRI